MDEHTNIREQALRGNFVLLNKVLTIAPLMLFFFNRLFDPTLICAAIPLIAVGSTYWSRGFSGFAPQRHSSRPDVIWPMIIGGIFSFFYSNIQLPLLLSSGRVDLVAVGVALAISVPICLAIWRFEPRSNRRMWLLPVCFFGSALPSSYAVATELNYRLDSGIPILINGTVTHKEVTSGKSGSFYSVGVHLNIDAPMSADFAVSNDSYQRVRPGDPALLMSGGGALNAKWIRLSHLDFASKTAGPKN